jgi:membrane protein
VAARSGRLRLGRAILAGVSTAGGSLLAAGLAFQVLFAILPALLLAAGIGGWVVEDPERRAAIVSELLRAFPPLADAVGETLLRLVENRGAVSLLGLAGLAWGASNLYGALDEAIGRLIPGERVRNVLERRVRGFLAVVLMLVAATAAVLTGAAVALLERDLPTPGGDQGGAAAQVLSFAGSGALIVLAVLAIYRTVPTAPPSIRAALLPAVTAGVAIALLTDLYALLAPRLVGALEAFGVLAALFGALLWLDYVCQLLLLGASWTRIRRDAEAVSIQGPRAAS